MSQANISVTAPYAREKFNWLWKAAKPSYIESIDLFSAEHGLLTMPPTDGSMISKHLSFTPRWRPKSEIEWDLSCAAAGHVNYFYFTTVCDAG